MRARCAIVWIVISGLICSVAGLALAYLARERYPDYAGPFVLFGVLAVGLSLGFIIYRVLLNGRGAEFATRRLASDRPARGAYMASAIGFMLSAWCPMPSPVGVIGLLASVCGLLAVAWSFFRAVPEGRDAA